MTEGNYHHEGGAEHGEKFSGYPCKAALKPCYLAAWHGLLGNGRHSPGKIACGCWDHAAV